MATTTCLQMITDALAEIGVIGEGETPNASMVDFSMRILNRMLASLSNIAEFAYFAATESRTLTGESSFTIGPTGDVVSERPIAVETATVVVDDITYPVKVIDNERYDNITYKSLAGAYTEAVYYDGTYPNGTVYVYPICSGATLNLSVLNNVKQFANELVQIDMPDGYEDAIVLNLALRLARPYGRDVSKDLKMDAVKAMTLVKRTNTAIPTMDLPDAVMGNSGWSYGYIDGA